MKPGRITLRDTDRSWDVSVGSDGSIEAAGRRFTTVRGPGGAWLVIDDEGQALVYAASEDGVLWVHDRGEVFVLDAIAGGSRIRARAAAGADLSAPMPSTVRAVLVSAGDTVAAGDILVMLEAMKMELPVRAPRTGLVRAVHCAAGQLVQPGVPLVELE